MRELIAGYEDAAQRLTRQAKRAYMEMKALAGADRAVKGREYRLLLSYRKEIYNIIDYLGGYYERKYAYGHKKCFTDYYVFEARRSVVSVGEFSRLEATGGGTENTNPDGYGE